MSSFKNKLALRLLDVIGNKDDSVLRFSIIIIFLVFGMFKWFEFEVRALEPLILGTWLQVFNFFLGLHGTSYFLGVVELTTVVLLLVGFKRPLYGASGAGLVILTGVVTLSLLPQLKSLDSFIFKDVMLIGIGLTLLKRDLMRWRLTQP